eukprot:6469019-Amphidinium_carterae.2
MLQEKAVHERYEVAGRADWPAVSHQSRCVEFLSDRLARGDDESHELSLHPISHDKVFRLTFRGQVPEEKEDPLCEGKLTSCYSICAVERFQLGPNALR